MCQSTLKIMETKTTIDPSTDSVEELRRALLRGTLKKFEEEWEKQTSDIQINWIGRLTIICECLSERTCSFNYEQAKLIREKLNLKPKELAKQLGIPVEQIYRYEGGYQQPSGRGTNSPKYLKWLARQGFDGSPPTE